MHNRWGLHIGLEHIIIGSRIVNKNYYIVNDNYIISRNCIVDISWIIKYDYKSNIMHFITCFLFLSIILLNQLNINISLLCYSSFLVIHHLLSFCQLSLKSMKILWKTKHIMIHILADSYFNLYVNMNLWLIKLFHQPLSIPNICLISIQKLDKC